MQILFSIYFSSPMHHPGLNARNGAQLWETQAINLASMYEHIACISLHSLVDVIQFEYIAILYPE